jgi:hypothetical protein
VVSVPQNRTRLSPPVQVPAHTREFSQSLLSLGTMMHFYML